MSGLGIQDKVLDSIHKLDNWVGENGWTGYDPYDIKGHRFWLRLLQLGNEANLFQKIERRLLLHLESRFPMGLRKLFATKKSVHAKGMGLFARAYVNLYHVEKRPYQLVRAKQCVDWLIENPSQGYNGFCWGLPFDWQSRLFSPAGTPFSITSSICENAFWSLFELTREKSYLDVCESVCNFYLRDLNIDIIDDERICFSYGASDNFHVHNTNVCAAEGLIRVGTEIDNPDFIEMGMKALNYTLADQNPDGSFYYWGSPDRLTDRIDHYHTGFVLRALYSIYRVTKERTLFSRIEKCYHHYIANLFENNMIPKLTPDNTYPINIHSCAEAILCLSVLSKDFPEGLETLARTTMWTIENMQSKEGHFYYMMHSRRTVEIPYIRWGQAWMFLALSNLLRTNEIKA